MKRKSGAWLNRPVKKKRVGLQDEDENVGSRTKMKRSVLKIKKKSHSGEESSRGYTRQQRERTNQTIKEERVVGVLLRHDESRREKGRNITNISTRRQVGRKKRGFRDNPWDVKSKKILGARKPVVGSLGLPQKEGTNP